MLFKNIISHLKEIGELIEVEECYASTFVNGQWDIINEAKVSGSIGGQTARNSQPTFEAFTQHLEQGQAHIYKEKAKEVWGELDIEQQRIAIANAKHNQSKIKNGVAFLAQIKVGQ